MNKQHSSKLIAALASASLISGLLTACGSGSREGYQYETIKKTENIENNISSKNPDLQDNTKQAETNGISGVSSALRYAIEMATNSKAANGTQKKMIIVGLDNKSLHEIGDQNAGKFVSLSGTDVFSYFQNTCPRQYGDDINSVYACLAGLYYGRTATDEPCYTAIDHDGNIRHVQENKVLQPFKPNSVPEFTRADVGKNMFIVFNAMNSYKAPNSDSVTHKQRTVVKIDSTLEQIDIFQENTDSEKGDTMTGDCHIKINGRTVQNTGIKG